MHYQSFVGVLALTLLSFPGALFTNAAPAATESALWVYPDSEDSANPRVPCIPPTPREDGTGKCMAVDAAFTYALSPLVTFSGEGSVTADIRGSLRREERPLLTLTDGENSLVVRMSSTLNGKLPTLAYLRGDKTVASAALKTPLPIQWSKMKLRWSQQEAQLEVGTEAAVTLALPKPVNPVSVTVQIASVDQLQIQGNGSLTLDWEKDYAAAIVPHTNSSEVAARLLGFDSYVISRTPEKRDYPMVQLQNAGSSLVSTTVQFALRGENSGRREQWSQTLEAPARSTAMIPIRLPEKLESDVYHLDVHATNAQPALNETKHFLFVENRDEPPGTAQFGLHDSNRRTFGFWPDALPIRLSHHYARWGYIQGPFWRFSELGITADTPSEEWTWNTQIDWAIAQGLTPYVCLQSTPFGPWMREREFEPAKMKKYPWGLVGGYPKMDLYRNFVRAFATRYQGKVKLYEVENEPNSSHGGLSPEDYIQISKAVFEETHAVDPSAVVYGICGTADFVSWIRRVFAVGGASAMDGVSIHTYVTPRMPEQAGLPGKLAEAKSIMKASGKPLHWVNSETGTYVALREETEKPISSERLATLIKEGAPGLYISKGWPNYAITEHDGGISIIRNVVFNFLAGNESFTFFGWNEQWPELNWKAHAKEPCFAMISISNENKRTPSQYTLAIAVMTEQMKGTLLASAVAINQDGVQGGLFPKKNGGELAVLWSPLGKRSVLIETPDSDIECRSFLGIRREVTASKSGDKKLFRLELGDEPVYLHAKVPGLHLLPSPIVNITKSTPQGQSQEFQFTLVNKYKTPWKGAVQFTSAQGWKITPGSVDFSMDATGRTDIHSACEIPLGTKRGAYPITAALSLPDGIPFVFPIDIDVRPTLLVSPAPSGFEWNQASAWQSLSNSPLKIDQVEQVVVGRSPLLASLQEEKYWKGADELSGDTRITYDAQSLFLYIKVKDANFRAPEHWPGVLGSCVELFLDTRPANKGLGRAAYEKGVHHWLLKISKNEVLFSDDTAKNGQAITVSTAGGTVSGGYWVAVKVPWSSLELQGTPGTAIGVDVGINGPPQNAAGRKSQLMLFGTASNSSDASGFGTAILQR